MISPELRRSAERLWNYASGCRASGPSDLIVVCGSYDLRVCDHACALLRAGIAPKLLISGNRGNWTRELWQRPEAEIFAERALANGVAASQIVLEPRATNFGENVAFARALCPDARAVTFVTKPNSVLRLKLTVPVQWPDVSAFVDAPPLAFPDEVAATIGLRGVVEEMVGDLHRVIEYPALGFQIAHVVPAGVLAAWHHLIGAGFTGHLLAGQPVSAR